MVVRDARMIDYYYVSNNKSTFLIKVENGIVVETPPIARKSLNRRVEDVLSFYRNTWKCYIEKL
jgi:hypothetical protein